MQSQTDKFRKSFLCAHKSAPPKISPLSSDIATTSLSVSLIPLRRVLFEGLKFRPLST